MGRNKGSANFAGSLEVLAGAPLDARLVVDTKADLTSVAAYPYKYVGMIVAVKAEGRAYMLIGEDTTIESNWKLVGGDSLDVVVYRPAGSIYFADKPAILTSDLVGNVYYVKDDFVTTSEFAEGAGNSYSAGTSIYVIDMGTQESPDIKWDILSASIDLSEYQSTIQYSTLPAPSADIENYIYQYIGATNSYYTNGYFYKCVENISNPGNYIYEAVDVQHTEGYIEQLDIMPIASGLLEGKIVQYIGVTNSDYINGYFYECVENAAAPGSFIWEQKEVQPNGGSTIQVNELPTPTLDLVNTIYQYIGTTTSDYVNGYFYKCIEDPTTLGAYIWKAIQVEQSVGALNHPITAVVSVGGISIGDNFPSGTSYDELWDALLDPTLYPTFTNPTVSMSTSGTRLLETGSTASRTFTITFNRGAINPAYGTNGKRAGAASSYALNGGSTQASNTFTETVSKTNASFIGTVNYTAGEQPKDSKGNNYDSPYPSGSMNTTSLTFEFVDALWANTSNIATVSKLALVSKSAKVQQFEFPAQTIANPEEFHVPASWTVTAVEVLNTLSNQWEDCSSEFTTGTTTHNDVAGTPVNYITYRDNRGYAAASRKVRVKWS